MKKITTKTLEENLALGWTTKQFAEYYEMSEKEFLSAIEKLSSVKTYTDSIKRRLTKNYKKHHSTSNISTPPIEIIKVEIIETENVDFTEPSIDYLLERAETLKYMIKKSEGFINNTPSYVAYIEEQKAKEMARHESYMEGFQKRIDAAIVRCNSVKEKCQKDSEELKQILEKIESFSNINIRVTKDGDIIIENNAISIPKKWQDICFDIMRDDSFKDLEIKDMKILAKLLSLLNSEENISKKIKISFESADLENYFKLLKEHKKL